MAYKSDLLTGESFLPKRINQRFANRNNRVKYNNDKANKIRAARAAIDRPLHTNFRILEGLMVGKKEQIVHREFLNGKGFHFGVHTHIEHLNGKNQSAVYGYIIIPGEKDQIKIVRK